MRFSFVVAFAAIVAASSAAIVRDPTKVGPVSPEKDPRTSLKESIRRMRLSLDRELVYLARVDEVAATTNTKGMVARQKLPLDSETSSTFGGFTDKVNDGSDIFRPIRPGVKVPSARQMAPEETTDPDDGPDDGPDESIPPTPRPSVVPPVSVRPSTSPRPVDVTPLPFEPETPAPREPPVDGTDGPSPSEGPDETIPPVPTFPVPSSSPLPTAEVDTPAPTLPAAVGETPDPSDSDDGFGTFGEDASPSPTDDGVCFPSDATVQVEDGSTKKMVDVQLGDRVMVASGKYSEVFMFTHKLASVRHSFVEIATKSGNSLTLTHGHYLYINGNLAAAASVRKGDTLALADNSLTEVSGVRTITSSGLFNPQTVHGDIVVNGIRASTYTMTVNPKTAHALLAPVRAVYERIGMSMSSFEAGANFLGSLLPSGSVVQ